MVITLELLLSVLGAIGAFGTLAGVLALLGKEIR
jgi:hypothetical protein